ncbi:hypothetical protein [Desulfurococcus mucosus]|uniref:Uncharacterized protein n=1 Tax=Desulfurococcus mucosus (strain ATCC 35584 / DSM 2162 / JCM 9187 / O7/1) TaxID=765177 RepID=E8R833_DESM0|nr:hypothetical protein [Desulfurococcus mucosus]ADV64659.1 hypothetical protein Desmu_0340 [Desulfurococcus mucosus DSM 2162]
MSQRLHGFKARGIAFPLLLALGVAVLSASIVILILSLGYMGSAMVGLSLLAALIGFSLLSASLYILRLAAYVYAAERKGEGEEKGLEKK